MSYKVIEPNLGNDQFLGEQFRTEPARNLRAETGIVRDIGQEWFQPALIWSRLIAKADMIIKYLLTFLLGQLIDVNYNLRFTNDGKRGTLSGVCGLNGRYSRGR